MSAVESWFGRDANAVIGWNSFRRRLGRLDRCSACGSRGGMRLVRRMRVRRVCCRRMIRRLREEDMESWRVVESSCGRESVVGVLGCNDQM
jgi:hypothetical protein